MKILLIAQHAEPSDGWGTLTRTTALGLSQRGHEVFLLLQKPTESLPLPQCRGLPSPLALLSQPLLLLCAAWKIRRTLQSVRPDLVHVLTEPYVLTLPLFFPRKGPPWVLTCCGTYAILPLRKWWTRVLFQRAYAKVCGVLAISTYTKWRVLEELAQQAGDVQKRVAAKIQVYTLGIEWPENLPPRVSHPEKRILFVGGVKERKGVLEIIEACGQLRRHSSMSFRLDIIGSLSECAYTQHLSQRVQELSLGDCVHVRGHVSQKELAQAYADADVFIMLSLPHGGHFEGYGLVFLEANARGIPVIGPNGSGCTDVIIDGRTGFLVDPLRPEQVTEKLRSILEQGAIDPDACREWAREHSVDRQARETEEFYHFVSP